MNIYLSFLFFFVLGIICPQSDQSQEKEIAVQDATLSPEKEPLASPWRHAIYDLSLVALFICLYMVMGKLNKLQKTFDEIEKKRIEQKTETNQTITTGKIITFLLIGIPLSTLSFYLGYKQGYAKGRKEKTWFEKLGGTIMCSFAKMVS